MFSTPSKAITRPHDDHVEPTMAGVVHHLIQCRSAWFGSAYAVIDVFPNDLKPSLFTELAKLV